MRQLDVKRSANGFLDASRNQPHDWTAIFYQQSIEVVGRFEWICGSTLFISFIKSFFSHQKIEFPDRSRWLVCLQIWLRWSARIDNGTFSPHRKLRPMQFVLFMESIKSLKVDTIRDFEFLAVGARWSKATSTAWVTRASSSHWIEK